MLAHACIFLILVSSGISAAFMLCCAVPCALVCRVGSLPSGKVCTRCVCQTLPSNAKRSVAPRCCKSCNLCCVERRLREVHMHTAPLYPSTPVNPTLHPCTPHTAPCLPIHVTLQSPMNSSQKLVLVWCSMPSSPT